MLNRIRYNLNETEAYLYDKFEGTVQVDETYIGGRNKGRFTFNRGRSTKQKVAAFGLLTYERVYTMVVPDTKGRTLKPIIYGMVKPGSTIVSNEWQAYNGLSIEGLPLTGIRVTMNETQAPSRAIRSNAKSWSTPCTSPRRWRTN